MVSKLVSFDSQWYPLTPSLGDLDPISLGLVPVLGKVIVSLLVCGGRGGGRSEERRKLNLSSNLSRTSWVLVLPLVLAYTMSSDLGSMPVAILDLNNVSLFNLSFMSFLIIDIWMKYSDVF